MKRQRGDYVFAIARICLGLIFLWAFFDKLLGLGFATTPEKAWLAGGSPTAGFLSNAVHGPFQSFYNSLAGLAIVDWLFMLGLLFIGLALVLGIMINIAAYSGAVLMFSMWTSLLPPANHPFLDEHIIYILLLIGLSRIESGRVLGLGKYWSGLSFIKKHKFLE